VFDFIKTEMEREDVKAVILAAGKGTRLKDITKNTPPLLSAREPILGHWLKLCAAAKIETFLSIPLPERSDSRFA